MRAHYPAIKAAGSDVLLVSFHKADRLRNWARNHALPYRLGSDVTAGVYARYGLGTVRAIDLFGPKSTLAGLKAFTRGGILPAASTNFQQQGGYFVVDRAGKVVYSRPSKGPADHPPFEELLDALGVER